ncbi:hypothetical protein AB0K43_03590 [Kitasatospora sp. NPDC049258]|uniref:hypothetical protein n=1 Tax=Kitasatospora sp. NPDC049258 TaxID=3155394 RepID=UPI00342EAECF
MSDTTVTTAAADRTYAWIITLQAWIGNGTLSVSTTDGNYTPPAGATRADAYRAIRESVTRQKPELANANTMFFSLEPNQL